MKIVVASDSFKGSLTSAEIAAAAAEGILEAIPDAEVVQLPVADGGEGTADVLVDTLGGRWINYVVADPLMRPKSVRYGIVNATEGLTAIIDMASASGLTLLSDEERDPMSTSTFGTGQLIADAFSKGCRRFLVGIGGSATCDGGIGMLEALGMKFFDSYGKRLPPIGASLIKIGHIDTSEVHKEILGCDFTIICDVDNPLYGPQGSAYVFAPQKGADEAQVKILDKGLQKYSETIQKAIGRKIAGIPGAGAGGGLGAAFIAFFNSVLKSGVDAVLDIVDFDDKLDGANLVITGEGRIDSQTLFGKLPFGVCQRTRSRGVPTVALAGIVENVAELLKGGFAGVFSIQSRPISLSDSMKPEIAKENIKSVTASIVNSFLRRQ